MDGFSFRASRRNQLCQHFDFGLLASQIVKEYTSVVLNHLICGNLLGQPWETHITPKNSFLVQNPKW